jgi:hypothetical protein
MTQERTILVPAGGATATVAPDENDLNAFLRRFREGGSGSSDSDDYVPTRAELAAVTEEQDGIDDPVRMYLREIGNVFLLTADVE